MGTKSAGSTGKKGTAAPDEILDYERKCPYLDKKKRKPQAKMWMK